MAMTPLGLTSRWVAASRALETESAAPLFRDPLARALASEAGFAMRAAVNAEHGAPSTPGQYLTIRTRFFDDAIVEAVTSLGLRQMVLVAAGMDARAFRLDWPPGTVLFELDRADVFAEKEPMLRQLGAIPLCDRRVVRCDLAEPWAEQISAAGFDPARPAAVLIEGLLCYLARDDVDALMRRLRAVTAAGSWLGLDVLGIEALTSPLIATHLARLRQLGCPWVFGVENPEAFLSAHGWDARVVMAGDEAANYGRWPFPVFPRHVPGLPRTYLARALRRRD